MGVLLPGGHAERAVPARHCWASAGGRVARRERRNLAAQPAYTRCAEIAGPLDFSSDPQVSFRRVASPAQLGVLTSLALFNALTALAFIG